MVVVDRWTGALACALQAALRATNEGFAHALGLGVRTVAAWHADPALVPSTGVQQILDIALERAAAGDRERFARLLAEQHPQPGAQALTVAVAVVRREGSVLLVCRRITEGSLSWQLPAGEVEPGESVEAAAVREAREETGLTVRATAPLGQRTHPATGRRMAYTACEVLDGTAVVGDAEEIDEVRWAAAGELAGLVPYGFYAPVRDYLDATLKD